MNTQTRTLILVRRLLFGVLLIFPITQYAQPVTEQELLQLAEQDVKRYIEVLVASMQKQSPIETGSGTISAVFVIENVLGPVTELGANQRPLRTKTEQINHVCSMKCLRAIIENGAAYAVQYVTPERKLLAYVEVSPSACHG